MASETAERLAEDDVVGIGDLFICRDYETKTYEFCDGMSVKLDSLQAASTDFDLTGQVIWTAAHLASWYMSHRSTMERFRGADMIELGAGAGLMGHVAAQYARSIALTDNEEEVRVLLERNLKHIPRTCVASVHTLSWGSDADHAALAAATGRATFPVVIGCDIVYWAVSIKPLFDTVARLLERPGGTFLLGFYNRNSSMHANMLAEAAATGLVCRSVDPLSFLPSPPPAAMAPFLGKCFMYEFTWRQPGEEAPSAAETTLTAAAALSGAGDCVGKVVPEGAGARAAALAAGDAARDAAITAAASDEGDPSETAGTAEAAAKAAAADAAAEVSGRAAAAAAAASSRGSQ